MMTSTPSFLKFTYEDYLCFPDDGKQHELIDGEHYVTPAPLTKHQRIISNLHRLIGPFIHDQNLGIVFSAPTDVMLTELDVVQPDFLFISANRMDIVTEANIQAAPDLVVEILSEGNRKIDEVIKRKLYERHQVKEYWLIDPVLETVKRFQLQTNVFITPDLLSLEAHDILTSELFPDFSLPLSDLFV
ncbi:Uma2 family endonuclease [Candidatus Nitrospira salsa]